MLLKAPFLLQVLEPLVRRRQRVMVFCNTINSCRAVGPLPTGERRHRPPTTTGTSPGKGTPRTLSYTWEEWEATSCVSTLRGPDHYLQENDTATANYHGDIPGREVWPF